MGPIRIKDVEDTQRKFFSIINHLAYLGEITLPEGFIFPDNFDRAYLSPFSFSSGFLSQDEIDVLLSGSIFDPYGTFKNIEDFTAFLTKHRQPEEPYGKISNNMTMCHFFESENNENLLADIEQKNKEQGMGNFQIPNTKIKLINYSICPKCGYVFSFKELTDYYANPKPDSAFDNRAKQYREDTRVFCHECNSYFLPALVIVDGTPKNEVQFLCRVQTANAIEEFYRKKGKSVLSLKKENILKKETEVKMLRAIRNDVSLKQLSAKPTLVSNLLQYTPANLALNLIDGSNFQKSDVLFGVWQ